MKIYLTEDNVMKILCDYFHVPYVEADDRAGVSKIIPKEDRIYWEGHPDADTEK